MHSSTVYTEYVFKPESGISFAHVTYQSSMCHYKTTQTTFLFNTYSTYNSYWYTKAHFLYNKFMSAGEDSLIAKILDQSQWPSIDLQQHKKCVFTQWQYVEQSEQYTEGGMCTYTSLYTEPEGSPLIWCNKVTCNDIQFREHNKVTHGGTGQQRRNSTLLKGWNLRLDDFSTIV